MKITKAVIPAAGHGTRFLPWTKAVPKEMLPLLNKPAIHHIVQEIADSGLNQCIMISARHKQALENYFSPSPDLSHFLAEKKKSHLLDEVNRLAASVTISYTYQEQAKGLGHAISLARSAITDEYFAVLLPDDIMIGTPPATQQLIHHAQTHNASIIAVQEVPRENVSSYGVIAVKKQISNDLYEISNVVEKPSIADAPSNLAIVGRYILSPSIFNALEKVGPSVGGEIQLTDAIAHMLKDGQRVLACTIQTKRFDVGTPTGWLEANIQLARN